MTIYCQRQHSIISLLLHHFYTTLIDVKRLYKVKSYGVLIIPLSLTHCECIMANQINIHKLILLASICMVQVQNVLSLFYHHLVLVPGGVIQTAGDSCPDVKPGQPVRGELLPYLQMDS